VVLHPVADLRRGFEVDLPATNALRNARKASRAPLKMINRGPHAEKLIREGTITVSDFDYPANFDEAAYLAAAN